MKNLSPAIVATLTAAGISEDIASRIAVLWAVVEHPSDDAGYQEALRTVSTALLAVGREPLNMRRLGLAPEGTLERVWALEVRAISEATQ